MEEDAQLNRALGLGGASAISIGLAFAALNFLGMAQLLNNAAAGWSWIAVAAGGAIVLIVRSVFAELSGIYPTAAGIRLWMSRAMNDRVALIITLTYMSAIVFVIGADAFIIGEAAAYAFHNGQIIALAYVGALLIGATVMNLRGIKLAGRAEQLVTAIVVATTMVIGVFAITTKHGNRPPPSIVHSSPLQALIFGIFLYTAFEWVTTNAEEVVRPNIVQRAMMIAIAVLVVSQAVFTVAMGLTTSVSDRRTAYPQLLVGEALLGRVGLVIMLGVTALTAVNTFNGGFITMSRFMYAVAREGKLPRSLTRLNDNAVPVVPVVFLGVMSFVLAIVVNVTGSWEMIVSVCAALEMMIYAAASFVVWRLRKTESDSKRPTRLFGGRPVALMATVVFGLLALAASVSVGDRTTATPLLVLIAIAGLVTIYTFTGLPRIEAREAREQAERRAARAQQRARRVTTSVITEDATHE